MYKYPISGTFFPPPLNLCDSLHNNLFSLCSIFWFWCQNCWSTKRWLSDFGFWSRLKGEKADEEAEKKSFCIWCSFKPFWWWLLISNMGDCGYVCPVRDVLPLKTSDGMSHRSYSLGWVTTISLDIPTSRLFLSGFNSEPGGAMCIREQFVLLGKEERA